MKNNEIIDEKSNQALDETLTYPLDSQIVDTQKFDANGYDAYGFNARGYHLWF